MYIRYLEFGCSKISYAAATNRSQYNTYTELSVIVRLHSVRHKTAPPANKVRTTGNDRDRIEFVNFVVGINEKNSLNT